MNNLEDIASLASYIINFWFQFRKLPKYKRIAYVVTIIGVAYVIFSFISVIFLEWYWLPWTGFGTRVLVKKLSDGTEIQPTRTLWDWLELLIIPVVLALGAYYFNRQERESEKQIANDRQQEANLQNYYDKMTELLLEKELRTSKDGDEVRAVARSRTLATLRTLDGKRKGLLIRFLYEAGVIGVDKADIIDLESADLSEVDLSEAELDNKIRLPRTNMEGANLKNSWLNGAIFNSANLQGANLTRTALMDSYLIKADLDGANMERAHFGDACLIGATLERANLDRTNFDGANMDDVTVSIAQLKRALSFNRTTMPDGTTYDAAWAARLGRPFPEPDPAAQPPEPPAPAAAPAKPEAVTVADDGDDGLGDE